MTRIIPLLFAAALAFASCSHKSSQPLQTVASVDLQKYSGKWYEIARIPHHFEKGCKCSMAEYTAKADGSIGIVNSCRKGNKVKTIRGRARVENAPQNSQLAVRFNFFARGQYYIIDLAPDYTYAVVGHPGRKYLWILSRRPQMPDNTYQALLEKVQKLGYKYEDIKPTVQDCQ